MVTEKMWTLTVRIKKNDELTASGCTWRCSIL
jgi:hypothetical protein